LLVTNVLEKLSRVVQTHVHGQVLDEASKTIAGEVGADSCSMFLLESDVPGLQLRAGFGHLALSDDLKRAAQAAASQAFEQVRSVRAGATPHFLVAVPMVQRGRPIGAIVAHTSQRPVSAEQLRTLSTIASHMVGIVESARFVEAVDDSDAANDYVGQKATTSLGDSGELVMEGTPASPGIAIGSAVFRRAFPRELARGDVASRGKDSERQRVRDGFEKTRNDIVKLQAAATGDLGEDQALIFTSHLMLLGDPVLLARIDDGTDLTDDSAAGKRSFARVTRGGERRYAGRDSISAPPR